MIVIDGKTYYSAHDDIAAGWPEASPNELADAVWRRWRENPYDRPIEGTSVDPGDKE